MKNYIGFVNDHSGSMGHLARAATNDYNANIAAIKEAATQEMLDTVVSVVGVGFPNGHKVTRQVQISNPHVLKPVNHWAVEGGTPLYDGIGSMIDLLKDLPDADDSNVSFLVMITTDGEECSSRVHNKNTITKLIREVSANGRWTFVFRVPKNANKQAILDLGVPLGNIQEWETTAEGMATSTKQTAQAMTGYFASRSSGARSTGSFYADASQVNLAQLNELPKKEFSLYVVPAEDNGIEIRPFVLRHRTEHLFGSAFYQLTKTEPRVQHDKQILLRERVTGKVFHGPSARAMIGLPADRNARLHPGDHKNYDIFIQSNSVNRKLVGGTGLIYWKSIGRPFTDADLAYLKKPDAPAANAVVQLPAVTPTNKPTKSPVPVTPRVLYFATREDARNYCRAYDIDQTRIKDNGKGSIKRRRWTV